MVVSDVLISQGIFDDGGLTPLATLDVFPRVLSPKEIKELEHRGIVVLRNKVDGVKIKKKSSGESVLISVPTLLYFEEVEHDNYYATWDGVTPYRRWVSDDVSGENSLKGTAERLRLALAYPLDILDLMNSVK